ncbi:class I SAM-dependent methyltransferase [Shewanella sp. OMA3-2]|uniref:class I SAM-dependent methyltransferase n=1 Tax=Shewanella sp. OMA3-2 TaxID=2908650 RepID=UPI001F38442E|nr:class I SAM-dependent methyltransferase [Shewanella sp. OMA3-2]UJF21372.1 methyltransferase domain-containing protein [Shewanella sp. OMA3-2]
MTIDFYNQHSDAFYSDTVNVNMTALYNEFVPLIPLTGTILDAGCGSGRDSAYFIKQGFKVTAFDASEALVNKARLYTGLEVSLATFDSFDTRFKFDAIWACASLLHVPSPLITTTFKRLASHLAVGGIFYCSFKYGDDDISRGGRFFTNANEERLASFIAHSDLSIKKTWITQDVRPDRQDDKWLNAILIKR